MGCLDLPLCGAYATSTRVLERLSTVLRRELRWWEIPVSLIEPGTFEAAIWSNTPDTPAKAGGRDLEDREDWYGEIARGDGVPHAAGTSRGGAATDTISDSVRVSPA